MNMVCQALEGDVPRAAALARQLWPGHTAGELERELRPYCGARPDLVLYLWCEGGRALRFAQCGLRRDYVEGCTGSPVGYLEGIFVLPQARGRGIARALEHACEMWARRAGCVEFASDCALENAGSQAMHRALGFCEAGRIVCYCKRL